MLFKTFHVFTHLPKRTVRTFLSTSSPREILMWQGLVLEDITIDNKLFLILHIVLKFLDDIIDINFLNLSSDFVETR